jgi:putative glycosyltransferase
MVAGLAHAKGELIFLIDCDLEEEPELLEKFHSAIRDSGADVVYGVRDTRESQLFERITANLFYKLFNLLSSYPVPSHPLNTRLMSKQYVASLLEHKEREFYMAGLWAMTGFKQVPFIARKHSKGSSSYTLRRKISIFVNAITSFSNQPLIFIFYVGCAILISSTISALYLIVRRIFYDVLLTGWPSLMVSLWFLGGMTIFCLGLIGIYLSKIFLETKQRPYAIIRQIYEKNIDGGLNTSGG